MTKKFKLPSGTTGFYNERNEWQATGSQMGRRNILPDDPQTDCKLRLVRLPFADGCYDRWGAYWGGPANVYCATNRADNAGGYFAVKNGEPSGCGCLVECFVRADSRNEAKAKVRQELPKARFFN